MRDVSLGEFIMRQIDRLLDGWTKYLDDNCECPRCVDANRFEKKGGVKK